MTDPFAPLDDAAKPIREPDKDGECVMPAPPDAPTPAMRHPDLGTPVRTWPYRDATGGLLGVAARFEHNGEKDIRYWTLWRRDGRLKWRCKHWPRPKPLYGLDRLAARPGVPVVVCEGEKACDAAGELMPDHVAICWPGGASSPQIARWDALVDRDVILWPDNDQPGWKAMASVASILKAIRARRVRLLNRELLATRVPLAQGDDASDLRTRDGWDLTNMLAFLVLPDALIEPPSNEDDKAQSYRHLVDGVRSFLDREQLKAAATGFWRKGGKHVRGLNSAIIAKDFAFEYRYLKPVDTRRVVEVVERFAREHAEAALGAIKERILGKPATDGGQVMLVRWLDAVTGERDEEVLCAMLHWLWLVKRSLAGLTRSYDIMPIVFGTTQGSGKSTAVNRLVSPLGEIMEPINAEVLTDVRRATELEKFAIGVWDEMEGAGKADIEALKNTITCETKTYRPMQTTDVALVSRIMCFIGTSNKPVESMVRDTTGARRFFQIDAQPLIDHPAINAIDYDVLWSAISETDPSPLASADIRDAVMRWQARSRGRDSVSLYAEWDDLKQIANYQPSPGVPAIDLPAYDCDVGFTIEQLRLRYAYFCKRFSEPPTSYDKLSEALKREGWERRRIRAGAGVRAYRWFRVPIVPIPSPTNDDEGGDTSNDYYSQL
jgi:hypothetical protein